MTIFLLPWTHIYRCAASVHTWWKQYTSVSISSKILLFISYNNFVQGSYFFYQQPDYPRDCAEVSEHCSSGNSSGIYIIKPDGYSKPFEVYCSNQISTGRWTVSIFYFCFFLFFLIGNKCKLRQVVQRESSRINHLKNIDN